jgi:hypothetical protein
MRPCLSIIPFKPFPLFGQLLALLGTSRIAAIQVTQPRHGLCRLAMVGRADRGGTAVIAITAPRPNDGEVPIEKRQRMR